MTGQPFRTCTLRTCVRLGTGTRSLSATALINHEKYPLDRECAGYDLLVSEARESLGTVGCFRLPGFITHEGVDKIKAECLEVISDGGVIGNQVGRAVNCYYTEGDAKESESHPVNTFFEINSPLWISVWSAARLPPVIKDL